MLSRWALLSTLVILTSASVSLADGGLPFASNKPSNERPRELEDVGVDEKLGSSLDPNLLFKDENGKNVRLGQFFDGKRPVLMAMVYYSCPNLCNLQLNGYLEDLKALDWSIGREFDFVLVSMEPTETPDLALQKKQSYLSEYVRPEAEKGWHFLTGTEENVKAFAGQVGFKYKWDQEGKQWAHQAAAYVVTPQGKISRYLYGIQLPVSNFRLAMVEASDGKIGGVMDKIAMFCFKYDPSRRTYAFYAWNLMRGAGALTVLVLGGFLIAFWIRQKKRQVPV